MNKKILSFLLSFFILSSAAFAEDGLRTMFLNNKTVICGINIRNFNAKDTNGDGIIDSDEESGNFINAVERLDEIKAAGVNVLHVLPITPVGKLKSLGTAGSLYAIADFDSINHQLVDLTSQMAPMEQAKYFVDECHKRGIKVVIDLPSCGAYDLFLTNPELFIKDKKQLSIVPTDWTDVRLLNTGNNENLNQDVLDAHKRFVDMVMDIGADGIRADVATLKPSKFWEEIINYSRERNPEFLYLAEASDSWREPPSKYAEFTPYDKLLEAGFDGYYGSFFNLKDWKTADEFIEHIKFNKKLLTSYSEDKSVIMSFTTHDEVSPIVLKGENLSVMMAWLEATLPFNPYFIDGFQFGDDYIYPWANSKAKFTETDDDYYFVHRGKLDIFNYSRKPQGNSEFVKDNFKRAFDFRNNNLDLVTKGTWSPIKTDKPSVFAYTRSYQGETILVVGNLDYKHSQKRAKIKVSGIKKDDVLEIIQGQGNCKTRKNKLFVDLEAGQIRVFKI
ncbi:MAG: alpha-glucosidase C-terminal domain-containing protein [Candidatus Gastranaerophilales bacterium]|nr:alpha-glucosidase C-terminal domain-containing protein [Candidatus Gastranaerophilales bacterium]MCM1072425.1 alpha-glucosidase C-terminal domain-containing protein [Bacteroides sp.]